MSTESSQSICNRENRDKLTKQQKLDIAQNLRNFAEEKLPDLNNIRHDGYKIVVLLQAAKIDGTLSTKCNDLISSAYTINNISDKSIVLAMIANALPNKMNSKRQQLLDELVDTIKQIPADIDRRDRYIWVAEILSTTEPQFAKRLLSNAMQFSTTIQTDDLFQAIIHTRLIDLAHKLDPSFAESMAEMLDQIPSQSCCSDKYSRKIRFT